MAKKSLICFITLVILSLCCGVSYATENSNSISLGNEIMKSIDKTENSMQNVVSGNVVKDAGNMVKNGMDDMKNGVNNMENDMKDEDGKRNEEVIGGYDNGNYNATRTTAEQTLNTGVNTITATTWMWIILVFDMVMIIAAILYYATQDNS